MNCDIKKKPMLVDDGSGKSTSSFQYRCIKHNWGFPIGEEVTQSLCPIGLSNVNQEEIRKELEKGN